jgi:hypothetical protein
MDTERVCVGLVHAAEAIQIGGVEAFAVQADLGAVQFLLQVGQLRGTESRLHGGRGAGAEHRAEIDQRVSTMALASTRAISAASQDWFSCWERKYASME